MTVHAPIPDYAAARRAMVDNQLRPQGVTDHGVLAAMRAVPREQFVPESVRPIAYSDRSIPLGGGRFQSSPSALGQLLTQMLPQAGEKALVVGAATGYAAAVLAHIGCDVVALESSPELAPDAPASGIVWVQGPLESGYAARAPYDLVLIDGAVDHIPDAIVKQLAEGGRLGAGLNERGVSRLVVGRKTGGGFGYLSIGDSGLAPLPGFSPPPAFTF